jgi:hypothetical protein
MGPDTFYQQVLSVGAGLALQTIADKLFWSPVQPTRILGVYATITTATTAADPGTLAFEKRITAGSDTGRVTTGVPTLTILGGTAVGKVVYKEVVPFLVVPGEEIVVKLTDAVAAGAAHISLWVDPQYELPANNANMIASA